jgi:hypothetical protein
MGMKIKMEYDEALIASSGQPLIIFNKSLRALCE